MPTAVRRRSTGWPATSASPDWRGRSDAWPGSGPRSVRMPANITAATTKPAGLHPQRLHGPNQPDQRAAQRRPDQESERPDDRERGLALHEVAVPTIRAIAPKAAASTNTRPAVTPSPAAKMSASGSRAPAARRDDRSAAPPRPPPDTQVATIMSASRPAVAELPAVHSQQHVGQGADQVGGAGQRAGAARVQHQPGQGDQRQAAADRVHQLRDQVAAAVRRAQQRILDHSHTGGPVRSASEVPRPSRRALSYT